jgi:uncharacterized membrane protein required for colicin V production
MDLAFVFIVVLSVAEAMSARAPVAPRILYFVFAVFAAKALAPLLFADAFALVESRFLAAALCYLFVFVATLALAALVGGRLRRLRGGQAARAPNRLFAFFWGAASGGVFCVFFALLLTATAAHNKPYWQQSFALPYVGGATQLMLATPAASDLRDYLVFDDKRRPYLVGKAPPAVPARAPASLRDKTETLLAETEEIINRRSNTLEKEVLPAWNEWLNGTNFARKPQPVAKSGKPENLLELHKRLYDNLLCDDPFAKTPCEKAKQWKAQSAARPLAVGKGDLCEELLPANVCAQAAAALLNNQQPGAQP